MRIPRAARSLGVVTLSSLLCASAHAQVAPAPPPAMPVPMGPVVWLSSDNAQPRLQVLQLDTWRNVCRAPCGIPVDPNGLYRVGGGDVRPSEEFHMPRPSGAVEIDAHVGSKIKHSVGLGMIIGGGGAMAAGTFLYVWRPTAAVGPSGGDGDRPIALLCLVIGAIVAASGIPFAMSSTSVQIR
jgi:hypothetical protein